MRRLGWMAFPVAVFVLSAAGGWTIAGQERSATPPRGGAPPGRGAGPLPEGAATGERDQER